MICCNNTQSYEMYHSTCQIRSNENMAMDELMPRWRQGKKKKIERMKSSWATDAEYILYLHMHIVSQ